MAKRKTPLTPEIIIATLKKSSLKTVLIEGKDDLSIYNQIENQIDDLDINILPCNGRTALLKVYESKDKIESDLLFICDSDLWIFEEDKTTNTDLITTNGYSIENELYQDGINFLNSLLTPEEINTKKEILNNICEWFSYEIEKYLNKDVSDCKFSEVTILNHQVMEKKSTIFTEKFIEKRKVKKAKIELEQMVKDNYQTHLRGKFLFQIFEKIFQQRKKNEVKYSTDQLFDLIFKTTTSGTDHSKNLNLRKNQILNFFK
ncbi:hypothetical protein [Wenyingzhuangia sp. 2_MG-2023]|uniref:hypothetical protein n=1 Tax=Wenyingzhuangia sp. 2_MG-2023 TaxID=3062639 RepID=UPI0026E3E9EF|nr:hypothetical protein [Wenyingzhuangia sp. 2_MG-2023]MDO6739163.1 hypothetical protein [Wenyingzhuangia sp. 2_MG-2023]